MPDIQHPAWRDKNKIGNLMARIEKHANGEVEMTNTQLKAAEIFLRKTLPDLNKTVLQGDPNKPLAIQQIERRVVDPANPNPQSIPPAPPAS